GGLITDRQVRVWGRRWGRTLQGFLAYGSGAALFLLAALITKINPPVAFTAICLASFLKDLAMAASWSATPDIGHRYSGSVAGMMNTLGNMGTVFSPPIVAWLAKIYGSPGQPDWTVSLYYGSGMFFIASLIWLFIEPRQVIVYAPEDRQRLEAEGVL